jgi:N12 class adenine-specific DNA methylase
MAADSHTVAITTATAMTIAIEAVAVTIGTTIIGIAAIAEGKHMAAVLIAVVVVVGHIKKDIASRTIIDTADTMPITSIAPLVSGPLHRFDYSFNHIERQR